MQYYASITIDRTNPGPGTRPTTTIPVYPREFDPSRKDSESWFPCLSKAEAEIQRMARIYGIEKFVVGDIKVVLDGSVVDRRPVHCLPPLVAK